MADHSVEKSTAGGDPASSSPPSSPSLLSSLRTFRYMPKAVNKFQLVPKKDAETHTTKMDVTVGTHTSVTNGTCTSSNGTASTETTPASSSPCTPPITPVSTVAPPSTSEVSTCTTSMETQTSSVGLQTPNNGILRFKNNLKKKIEELADCSAGPSPVKKSTPTVTMRTYKTLTNLQIPTSPEGIEQYIDVVMSLCKGADRMEVHDLLIKHKYSVTKVLDDMKRKGISYRTGSAPDKSDGFRYKRVSLGAASVPERPSVGTVIKPSAIPTRTFFSASTSSGSKKLKNFNSRANKSKRAYLISDEEDDDDDNYSDEDYYNPRAKKQSVFEFVSKVSEVDLASIPGITAKKADQLIKLRPFTSWEHMCQKMRADESLSLSPDTLYGKVAEMLRLRSEVTNLMKQCTDVSKSLARKVSELTSESSKLRLSQQPETLGEGLTLAGYQMVGLNWLRLMHERNLNGILADEMGLGKTIQVIALLAYLKEQYLKEKELKRQKEEKLKAKKAADNEPAEQSEEQEPGEQEPPEQDQKEKPDTGRGVHLIVVPSSTLENWLNELKKWCPALKVEAYYGSQEDRRQFRHWWRDPRYAHEAAEVDVILTTYNLVTSTAEDKVFFRRMSIQYIVYDEAHMLKNMATRRYATLMRVHAEHRLLLTGTPLQNNLVELMSLLIFVMPQFFFNAQEDLKTLFKSTRGGGEEQQSTYEKERIEQAKKIMEPFVLRRLKNDVLKDLPPKTGEMMEVEMTPPQAELYTTMLARFREDTAREDSSSEGRGSPDEQEEGKAEEEDEEEQAEKPADDTDDSKHLSGSMAMMMQLRRVANHPALARNVYTDRKIRAISKKLLRERDYGDDQSKILNMLEGSSDHQIHQLCLRYLSIERYALSDEYLLDSGKFRELDELLPVLQSEGHRVLLFSQFRQALDVIEDYVKLRGHKYLRIDGQTPVVERQGLIDEYNQDPSILIFLLTTKSGGCGINLASADTVIIHDIDLNPYNDKQAEDRCHRVGQTRPVRVIRMVGKGTIEETMFKVAQNKLSLEQQITHGVAAGKQQEKKLLRLLKEALKSPEN